ncbi:hypothetical protein K2P47_02330 [Patescibacteria group bacterium]|nr:hypothetical protein [Patescibacteria group bacterium]
MKNSNTVSESLGSQSLSTVVPRTHTSSESLEVFRVSKDVSATEFAVSGPNIKLSKSKEREFEKKRQEKLSASLWSDQPGMVVGRVVNMDEQITEEPVAEELLVSEPNITNIFNAEDDDFLGISSSASVDSNATPEVMDHQATLSLEQNVDTASSTIESSENTFTENATTTAPVLTNESEEESFIEMIPEILPI